MQNNVLQAQQEASPLAMVVLPKSAWQEITSKLNELKGILQDKKKEEINSEFIESKEARKLLGVSQKTWQDYRDKRVIPFIQFGRKIFVRRSDLNNFLDKHYITNNQ